MSQQASPLLYIRATLYYIGFYLVTIVYSSMCLLIAPFLPFRARFKLITALTSLYLLAACVLWCEG